MENILYVYVKYNIDVIIDVLRVVIGILLLTQIKTITNNVKRYMINLYYWCLLGSAVGFLLNPTIIYMSMGGILGICFCLCILKVYKGDLMLYYIIYFISIYEILECIFYSFNINFSEIFKTYDDIFVDYKTIYVKIVSSIILALLVCIIQKMKNFYINDKIKYSVIGNYFILGALFCETVNLFDVPYGWKDVFIPLLNVNYSPNIYYFAIIEIILFVTLYLYICNKKSGNRKY